MLPTTDACIAQMRAGRKPTGENRNEKPSTKPKCQYSSGNRIVVTERSHSVMIQKRFALLAR